MTHCTTPVLKAGHPGVPCYTCLFVWAMVGWITLPFFSFCFLKASVLCICIIHMYFHVCVYNYLHAPDVHLYTYTHTPVVSVTVSSLTSS